MLPNFSHNMMMPYVLPDRVTWPFIDFTVWLLAVTFTFDASYLGINRAKRLKWCCKFELFWKKFYALLFKGQSFPLQAWFSLQGWTQAAFQVQYRQEALKLIENSGSSSSSIIVSIPLCFYFSWSHLSTPGVVNCVLFSYAYSSIAFCISS